MKRPEDEPVDWEEVRNLVVDQLKRAGHRVNVDRVRRYVHERGGNIDSVIDRLIQRGYLAGEAHSDRRRPTSPRPKSPHRSPAGDVDSREHESADQFQAFRRYCERTARRFKRSRTGMRVHLTVYAGVNLFLLMIWGITGAGFPWFLIPAAGWGIGIANHLNMLIQRYRQSRELAALPDLTATETRSVKTFHSARSSFGSHLASAVSVTGFLWLIYAITGGGFPWYLIPAGGLALSLLIHRANYGPKARELKRRIRGWIRDRSVHGLSGGGHPVGTDATGESTREPAIVQEASAIRRAIMGQAESAKADGIDVGTDLEQLLDTYLHQIRSLATRRRDIETVISEFPVASLERDRVSLIERRTRAVDEGVKSEYDKSIAEVDQQIASLDEIERAKEVLDLRLRSAMNLLRQLQLDLARAKGVAISNTAAFDLLKQKSDELSRYLDDLGEGYAELDS